MIALYIVCRGGGNSAIMAEEVFNEVIETVDTINHHRMELNQLMEALKEAQSQVR